MSHHHPSDDRGEGPSSTPALQATIRIRPVTIRFTDLACPISNSAFTPHLSVLSRLTSSDGSSIWTSNLRPCQPKMA